MNSSVGIVKQFHFWQQWLFWSSILFALAGIMFALYGNNPLFIHYNNSLAKIFWRSNVMPETMERFRAFIWAPLGGTITCCYILLAYIAWFPFNKRERWAWWSTAIAFGTWIIIDTAICFWYDVYFQVYIINAFSFTVKALPLIFTWKYFFGKQ